MQLHERWHAFFACFERCSTRSDAADDNAGMHGEAAVETGADDSV